MKVILLENVKRIGSIGEIIDVKRGFARNYLIANKKALYASKENINEVILATSATVEGQTTAYYIQDSLKDTNTKITVLAQGLPVGGEIENLDDGTLYSAFKFRSDLSSNSD